MSTMLSSYCVKYAQKGNFPIPSIIPCSIAFYAFVAVAKSVVRPRTGHVPLKIKPGQILCQIYNWNK